MQYKTFPVYAGMTAAMLLVANSGLADTASTDAKADASPSLEEVVVTATRREQNLQDVEITVNAVSADALANAQIHSTGDLNQLVPNLTISSQVGAWVVYLRGVGQLATNAGQEPSVATYVDGVYQSNSFSSLLSLADVERVEVLKGPQGTLFGRNATGGLINIVMRDPSHTPSAEIEASYGNFQTSRLTAYATTGLGDKAAIDVAAYIYDQNEGYGTDETSGQRIAGSRHYDLRSKLLIEPTDTTKIRLSGSYTENRSGQGNALAILPGSVAFNGSTALHNFYNIQNDGVMPLGINSTYQGSAHIDQELPKYFDLVSISSYTHMKDRETEDASGTPVALIDGIFTQRADTFSQEFQAVSKKDMPVTGIIGLYFFHQLAEGEPTGTGIYGLAFGGGEAGEQSRSHLLTNSYAIYGEGTYAILPKLDLTLGARYTHDEKSLTGGTDAISTTGVVTSVPIGPVAKSWGDPTYRAMFGYHITDSVLAYALYSRGFKSGGFDTGFANGVPFQPETVDDYEVGIKTELFDRRVRLNAAYFYYKYNNLQLPVLVPGPGGSATQVTLNATNAKVDGLDLDGAFQVTENFSVNFGLGILDSKYTDFPNAPCTFRTGAGATVQQLCDVSGRALSHAPKVTANAGSNYSLPTEIGKFGLNLNYALMTKFYYDVADRLSQGGYGILNGEVSWTDLTDKYRVGIYGENLTNKEYTVAQYAQAGISDTYVAGSPRLYGIRFKVKF